MRELKDDYSWLKYFLLSLLTLGIYDFWVVHSLSKDVNKICVLQNRKIPGVWTYIGLSIVTFGVYHVLWWYQLSKMLKTAIDKHGLYSKINPSFILLEYLLGVTACLGAYQVFEAVNELASDYNANSKAYTEPEPAPKKTYGYSGWGD